MSALTEIVYKGADNPNSVTFYEDNVAMDFSATTRMVLTLSGAGVTIDSDILATAIDWSAGSGKVIFKLNDESIEPGLYKATLKVYDATHTSGQVIAHHESGSLNFNFTYSDLSSSNVNIVYAPTWMVVKAGGDKHKSKLYEGQENIIRLSLLNGGEQYTDIAFSARMVFRVYDTAGASQTIDSNIDSTLLDWDIGGGMVDVSVGTLTLTDESVYSGELIVYNAKHPNGLVWIDRDDFEIEGA